jgi:hypothetical protein
MLWKNSSPSIMGCLIEFEGQSRCPEKAAVDLRSGVGVEV